MCLVAEAQLYCSALLCFSCFDARTILLWTPTNSCSLSTVYYQIWDYAESPTNPQTFLNPNLHDLFDLMFEILLACVFRTLSVSFETKQFWGLPKYNYALGWSCKNYILLGAFFFLLHLHHQYVVYIAPVCKVICYPAGYNDNKKLVST